MNSLFSCKKAWRCECSIGNKTEITTAGYEHLTKKKATDKCEGVSNYGGVYIATGPNCSLKAN